MDEHKNALCPTNREDLRRAIACGVEKLKGEQYDVFLRTLKSVPTRVKIVLEKKVEIVDTNFFTKKKTCSCPIYGIQENAYTWKLHKT